MNQVRANILLHCFLVTAAQTSCAICIAQTLDSHAGESSSSGETAEGGTKPEKHDPKIESKNFEQQAPGDSNALGVSFLKNLVSDQKAIWTSPRGLRWADGIWLFPLAAATAGFLATDRTVPPALPTDPKKLNRYVKVSDYGLYSEIGAGGGLYIWGKLSHNDHQRETGILAGEAAIDSFAVDTTLKKQ